MTLFDWPGKAAAVLKRRGRVAIPSLNWKSECHWLGAVLVPRRTAAATGDLLRPTEYDP